MDKLRECCFKTVPDKGKRLIWEITHTCYFKCDYCFQEKKRLVNPIRVLNHTDLLEICSKLDSLEISDVLITGGEIFHAQDIIDPICNKLKNKRLPISFSTNYLFKKDFINYLFSFLPRSLNISLDPPKIRASNDFNKYIESVEYILDLGASNNIKVKITAIINKDNIDNVNMYIKEMKKLIKKYKSFSSLYITNPYEIGFLKTNIRANYRQLKEIIKLVSSKSFPEIKLVNFHRFNMPLQSCQAGSKYIHLEPNGNIYPCHLFANLNQDVFLMGNILNDKIDEINFNLNSFGNQVNAAIVEYKSENTKCQNCEFEKKCGAGCLAEIISIGNLIEPQLICKKISTPRANNQYKPLKQLPLDFSKSKNDLTEDEREQIEEYIKKSIWQRKHDLAHGYDHIECVVKLARFIAEREGANLRIITAAAYFHDFAPRQKLLFESHTKLSAQKAVTFLKNLNFSQNELDNIYHCIDTSSYGSSDLGYKPESLEAKVVSDADWLDAIGARGIARVFAFGTTHGCETLGKCEWDPKNPPKKRMSLVGPDPSPIYHFFSKLLWVKDKIKTKTGREIAEIRHKRLVKFLIDYKSEMDDDSFLKYEIETLNKNKSKPNKGIHSDLA